MEQETQQEDYSIAEKRKIVKEKLALGQLEDESITVEVEEQSLLCLICFKVLEWNKWE